MPYRVIRAPVLECTFCTKKVKTLIEIPERTGEGICVECIQKSNELLHKVPKGCVECFKCKNRHAFIIKYPGATVRVESSMIGGEMTYIPVSTSSHWDIKKATAIKANCCVCKAYVPPELFK